MAHVQFDGAESNVSKPVKRMRWATQRLPTQTAGRKRLSILNRGPKVHVSPYEEKGDKPDRNSKITDESPMGTEVAETGSQSRTIYTNVPLPDAALDEEGKRKEEFPRNKIRTSKYTPLSFLPKNLWFQFHNIANVYFLFIIVLNVGHRVPPRHLHS